MSEESKLMVSIPFSEYQILLGLSQNVKEAIEYPIKKLNEQLKDEQERLIRERSRHEDTSNKLSEAYLEIKEDERRGELAGWNAARERIVDPKHFGSFITADPVTKLAYDTFTDWRNSEEYKK